MLFAALLISSIACAQSVETRELPAFNTLHAGGSFDTFIEQGNEESVRIEAGGVDTKKIITEVIDGNLKIYLEKGKYNNIRTKVYITYKKLISISQSGSGKMECRSDLSGESFKLRSSGSGGLDCKGAINAKDLEIMISGSGGAYLKSIEADKLNLTLSGSGNLDISSGTVDLQNISVSGSGQLKSFDVKSNVANVQLRGSGNVNITVNGSIEGVIAGSGGINYRGDAQVSKSVVAGSGRMRKI